MAIESYYAPTATAQRLSLTRIVELISAAGLPCKAEPEAENMFWIVFDGWESNVLASVEDDIFVFGTFNLAMDDSPSVAQTFDEVMQSIGFSADEGDDYF